MGFIMQNDEDVSSRNVQERIKTQFAEVARQHIQNTRAYPNFCGIPNLVLTNRINYKELAMITEIIPVLNQ